MYLLICLWREVTLWMWFIPLCLLHLDGYFKEETFDENDKKVDVILILWGVLLASIQKQLSFMLTCFIFNYDKRGSMWCPHLSQGQTQGYQRDACPTLVKTRYNSNSNLRTNNRIMKVADIKKSRFLRIFNLTSQVTKYINISKIYNLQKLSKQIHSKS